MLFSLPESTLAACWWLTNAPAEDRNDATEGDFSARSKLLCRSFGVPRTELHQSQVAAIAKVRAERQRRRNRNAATVLLLKQNPLWNRGATAEQLSTIRNFVRDQSGRFDIVGEHCGCFALGTRDRRRRRAAAHP